MIELNSKFETPPESLSGGVFFGKIKQKQEENSIFQRLEAVENI